MGLTPGTRLGPYEITSAIGAGGMGEVYRARDTRLDRTVAIKVLPTALATDQQFRDRFDREARALSGLDHPHICALYDVGDHQGTAFLVMPLLDGQTLAARLERGPLRLADALTIGAQIADALDKAHRAGIVHRDLKPGNVMLTKSGAKLLDFGLSKGSVAVLSSGASVATVQENLTGQGAILGTLQYMAPEQLEGREADARTDIFALGAVLYEAISGKKAFEGKSHASLIAAILEREPPPVSAAQPVTPPALDRLIRKCLAKDPDDRWQTARDLRDELQWIAAAPPSAPDVGQVSGVAGRGPLLPWLLTSAGLAVAVAALVLARSGVLAPRLEQPDAMIATYDLPSGLSFGLPDSGVGRFAISPDGRRLAFSAQDGGGGRRVWVRRLDSQNADPVAGTDGALGVFWSGDSRFIAFEVNGKMKRVDLVGGIPVPLTEAATLYGRTRGAWNKDDTVLFGTPSGLMRVTGSGGKPVQVTKLDTGAGESAHGGPAFLPDGRRFVFAAAFAMNQPRGIFLGSLDDPKVTLILPDVASAAYANGRLLFMRGTTLVAQRFDADRGALEGEPSTIADNVQIGGGRVGAFSVSEAGVLAYVQTGGRDLRSRLQIVDRTGAVTAQIGDAADQISVRLSPDGTRASASILEGAQGTRDLWIYDLRRGVRVRLTSDPGEEIQSVWSPDGSEIAYSAARTRSLDVFRRSSSGVGPASVVLEAGAFNKYVTDWSRDGRLLYFSGISGSPTVQDIWMIPLQGAASPLPLVQTKYAETNGRFSPNGRWVAFASNDGGRPDIYVTPSTPGGPRLLVSTSGGNDPCWRRDGKELFYVSPDRKLMAVDVRLDGALPEFGTPHALFDLHARGGDYIGFYAGPSFDAMPDGKHFLINALPETSGPPSITIVANWPSLLKR